MKAEFSRQNGDLATSDERRAWIKAAASEMRADGAELVRATIHPEIVRLTLLEGWKDARAEMDEPEFHLVAAA